VRLAKMQKKFTLTIFLASAVFLTDQAAKYFARLYLDQGTVVVVLPGVLNLTLVQNTGVAFGLFKGFSLLLSLFGIASLIALFIFFPEITSCRHLALFGGLIGGGALSNLFDRLFLGSVTDYLELTFLNVFNLADIAITAGVIFLIFDFVVQSGEAL